MLCEDGEFTRLYEECDAHELNLFLQDKLISLVPKSVRKFLKMQGFAIKNRNQKQQESLIRLTESTLSDLKSSSDGPISTLSLPEVLDDDQKSV